MVPEIRPLRLDEAPLIGEVARRMRRTLQHVLGDEVGAGMYSHAWLADRVRFHLDPARSEGRVLVAMAPGAGQDLGSALMGHTIVRVEDSGSGESHGLFSTTWVEPVHRRQGVAEALLDAGEAWLMLRGQTRFLTDTATDNLPLQRLFQARGYCILRHSDDGEMVRLERLLELDL